MMDHLGEFLVAILLACLLLVSTTACADIKWSNEASSNYRTYTIIVYSGSDVIREWHNVRHYTIHDSGSIAVKVDGKNIAVLGGTVIIERESD